MAKGLSIPTKFELEETALINELHLRTGLSRSEIVRRAVRLLRIEVARRGQAAFILEELSQSAVDQAVRPLETAKAARLNEPPSVKQDK
ncbi:MAG: ribbon-helix-helix protein, CopG family [Methylacidiphilales bacterium]|nr:ribbon-helix-helix protein, CopG family [Candidatus Methylacidiphilales bacterium]